MRVCNYCFGESSGEGSCPHCQSTSFDGKPASQIVRGEPFHYNGYVIWWLADWTYDTAEYLFYLGDRLVERFTVSRDVLRRFVPEHCDAMPFIWDLFLLAQGEEEVLRIVEQNAVRPRVFEITVKPTAKEGAIGLSYHDLCTAIAELEHSVSFFERG